MRMLRSVRLMLVALALCVIPASSYAGVFISVGFAPPVLPVYEQPICPEPGLMWTPGYWAYGDDGYYWVPGAWVPAPYEGALWTPGYWGWGGGLYAWHPGYWGMHVGYYGGVNYGFGYMGIGFAGGEWRGNQFAYNTAVMRVNQTVITNVYVNTTIVNTNTIVNNNHVAYSGGPGGVQHAPAPQELVAAHDQHVAPTTYQVQHVTAAKANKSLYVKNNGGHPAVLAEAKPLPAEKHAPPAGFKLPPAKPQTAAAPAASSHPAPAAKAHPAPATPAHPAPAAQPHQAAQPHPAPAAHPTPAERPAPAPRPAPAAHQAPAARPAPTARPAPAARPAPTPKPAPAAHQAPAPRPATKPAPKEEPKKN